VVDIVPPRQGRAGDCAGPACFRPERGLDQSTRLAAAAGTWICFEDEAEQEPAPAEDRGLARRGRTSWSPCPQGLGPGVAEGWSASSPGRIRVSTENLRLPASLHAIHTSSTPDLRTRLATLIAGRIYLNAAGLQLTLDPAIVRLDERVA
jgi:hypothetical protein